MIPWAVCCKFFNFLGPIVLCIMVMNVIADAVVYYAEVKKHKEVLRRRGKPAVKKLVIKGKFNYEVKP